MKKFFEACGLLLVLLIILLIAVVIWFFWVLSGPLPHSSSSDKKKLDAQMSEIKPPDGCTETRRVYTSPDIDTVSMWNVSYDCPGPLNEVYLSLKARSASENQKITLDKTLYMPSGTNNLISASLVFSGEGFVEGYNLTNFDKLGQRVNLSVQWQPEKH